MTNVKEQVQRLVGQAAPAEAGNLYLLAELSQEFALSLDVEETLQNAVATIIRFLDAEAASVFLLEDGELVCRASAGPSSITGMRLPLDRGIVGRTLASGVCQMVRDVRADPDFNVAVDHSTGFTTRSITRIATPPTISATATISPLPSIASIWLMNRRPSTPEGRKAIAILRTKRHDIALPWTIPSITAQNVRQ